MKLASLAGRCARFLFLIIFVSGAVLQVHGTDDAPLAKAREAFEEEKKQRELEFEGDREKLVDKYAKALLKARKKALSAGDLDEALRLDEAQKRLDLGVHAFLLQTLTVQLGDSLWSDVNSRWGIRLDEGGKGGVYQKGEEDKIQIPSRWEVIDVNTFISGVHPRLSVATLGPARKTFTAWQRTADKSFVVEGEHAGPTSPDGGSMFRSGSAHKAHRVYLKKLGDLRKKHDSKEGKAERAYRRALEVAKKKASKSGDLDAALELDRLLRTLGAASRETLEAQLQNTTWKSPGKEPWSIRFERGGQCFQVPPGVDAQETKAPWVVIDENTLRAGEHPALWILVFDAKRAKARLIGSDTDGRHEMWLSVQKSP